MLILRWVVTLAKLTPSQVEGRRNTGLNFGISKLQKTC